jgi:hypothetical protein
MFRRNTNGHRGRSIACVLATAGLTLCLAAGVNARTSFTSHLSERGIATAAHWTDLPTRVSVLASDDDYVELLAVAGFANLPTAR